MNLLWGGARREGESSVRGVIECGTSKIIVLVAERSGARLNLIGAGEAESRGMRRGWVVDRAAASESLGQALLEAERSAGVSVRRCFLTLGGAQVEGAPHEGMVTVGGVRGRVSAADIANVSALARARALAEGRCLVHHLAGGFKLDGRAVESPLGLAGGRLRTRTWQLHADRRRVADLLALASDYQIEVEQVVWSGLASAMAATSAEERAAGVAVIDCGAGTTEHVAYLHGRAWCAGVVPAGGDHFTNDLSVGLRLRIRDAEVLKRRHGRARVATGSREEKVWLDDERGVGAVRVPLLALEQITAARARETLELVRRRLEAMGVVPEELRAGIVLTGGGAKLEGWAELAAEVFGVGARIGQPGEELGRHLQDPAYAAVAGALQAGWMLEERAPTPPRPRVWRRVAQAVDYVLNAGAVPGGQG
jgi:cell division protein FtsA